MERTGLLAKIHDASSAIDRGRKWLDTDGLEHDGRISYKRGLILGLEAFREAQTHAAEDLYTLFAAEYAFIGQELEFCAPKDIEARTSLSKAVREFDEAFLALEILQNADSYKSAEKTYSTRTEFRHQGMPADPAIKQPFPCRQIVHAIHCLAMNCMNNYFPVTVFFIAESAKTHFMWPAPGILSGLRTL